MRIEPLSTTVSTRALASTLERAFALCTTTQLLQSTCPQSHLRLRNHSVKKVTRIHTARAGFLKFQPWETPPLRSWCSSVRLQDNYLHGLRERKREFSSDTQQSQFGKLTEQDYQRSKQRFSPITSREITNLFGPGISRSQGNHLLDTLQKQRVTGTLDYDVEGPGVNTVRIAKALQWLRENYQLDEDAAIIARIEREEAISVEWKPQQGVNSASTDVYGHSELEERIGEIKEKRERRQEEEEMAGNDVSQKELTREPNNIQLSSRQLDMANGNKSNVSEWIKKYRERAKLSALEKPPKVKTLQAVGPCTIFAIALIGSCIWFAFNYVPPSRNARLFPDIPPAAATICGIITINVVVWFLWKIPPFWRYMNRNFLLVPATPNPISLLGSVFSHHGITHLAANMVGLWFIGTSLCDEIGRGNFLALYLACGVTGSWLSLLRFVAMKNFTFSTLGASGAVLGVVASYCSLFPSQGITLAFVPEQWRRLFAMKAEYVLYTLLLFEVYATFRGRIGGIDHAAHLGGLLAGVAGAEALRRQARLKKPVLGQVKFRSFRD